MAKRTEMKCGINSLSIRSYGTQYQKPCSKLLLATREISKLMIVKGLREREPMPKFLSHKIRLWYIHVRQEAVQQLP
jgi:hypothetical protein